MLTDQKGHQFFSKATEKITAGQGCASELILGVSDSGIFLKIAWDSHV